jgi:hypothetical protein
VTTLQAILFALMLVWTPGMVLFAYFLWKETGVDRDVIRPEPSLSHVQPATNFVEF